MAHTKIIHKRVTSNGNGTTQYAVKELTEAPNGDSGRWWKNMGAGGLTWSSNFPDAALAENLTNYRLKKRVVVKTNVTAGNYRATKTCTFGYTAGGTGTEAKAYKSLDMTAEAPRPDMGNVTNDQTWEDYSGNLVNVKEVWEKLYQGDPHGSGAKDLNDVLRTDMCLDSDAEFYHGNDTVFTPPANSSTYNFAEVEAMMLTAMRQIYSPVPGFPEDGDDSITVQGNNNGYIPEQNGNVTFTGSSGANLTEEIYALIFSDTPGSSSYTSNSTYMLKVREETFTHNGTTETKKGLFAYDANSSLSGPIFIFAEPGADGTYL